MKIILISRTLLSKPYQSRVGFARKMQRHLFPPDLSPISDAQLDNVLQQLPPVGWKIELIALHVVFYICAHLYVQVSAGSISASSSLTLSTRFQRSLIWLRLL